MKAYVKITARLLADIRQDLERPHAFAYERVGFMTAGVTTDGNGRLFVLVRDYHPVADGDYVRNPRAGASIGAEAMRKGLQLAYKGRGALLHIHTHGSRGRPAFSGIDLESAAEFVPGFFNVVPQVPHGLIVLSDNSARGLIWMSAGKKPTYVEEFIQVGAPYVRFGGAA